MQAHLEIRFEQLNVATELELWQEAFRSVEDIHGLIAMAKKPPKPKMMANYYEKLTQIFWVSEHYLFHAYAWYKLFTLTINQNKSLTSEEKRLMFTSLVLASLSIPVHQKKKIDSYFEFDVEKEKNLRLAALLGFTTNPKRETLLHELFSKNITQNILPELRDIYTVLEIDFHPLELCDKVKPLLDFISQQPKLKQYVKNLERLTLYRLLQQLSQVYQSIKITEVAKYAYFISFHDVEKFIVETVRNGHLHIRIDHQNGALHFGDQILESEQMRSQLTTLSKRLNVAYDMIHPTQQNERSQAKSDMFKLVLSKLDENHKKILARKAIIEQKKEKIEQEIKNRAREQHLKAIEQQKELKVKAAKILEEEERNRISEQLEQDAKARELQDIQDIIVDIKKIIKIRPNQTLTKESLIEESIKRQKQEKEQAEKKCKKWLSNLIIFNVHPAKRNSRY